MKLYKLIVHQKAFSDADLIINPKEFPHLKIGDIVEIYHPDDDFSRLLLQITSFKEDLQGRETISVEQSIASTFQLRVYNDVYLNKVIPETVALDSVEVTFKDQYLGRSEMWRLRNSLVNTCVYLNKKIEYCGGSIRCQVYEMWAAGERVACGVISEDTKVVFRSSTSMVYLFLQMSSEMWDFDVHGDLYFEKAVNGFLSDLFKKWKTQKSNHEVTIVLFSRTFYKAESIHEFPDHMRECLQQDYKGRYYEDFYRVAVQNERYDDWTPILALLRQLFTNYQKMVLEYHNRPGIDYPPAVNSTAAQGNFLEVLNMSLNVFEKHYLDRSLDRTGQLSVVLTPGVGVFEVDRALTSVTKQRVIDNGVGSDLVCVGEQPLHAVPLLKFHSKDNSLNDADDFSMPHWINLSFYSTNKKVAYSSFIPRIKLPPCVSNRQLHSLERINSHTSAVSTTRTQIISEQPAMIPTTEKDYDAYDDQVFTLPSNHIQGRHKAERNKKISVGLSDSSNEKVWRRKMSDSELRCDISYSSSVNTTTSQAVVIPQVHSRDTSPYPSSSLGPSSIAEILRGTNEDDSPPPRLVVGSASPTNSPMYMPHVTQRPSRSLINPFDPSHVTIKMTSNRRRWTHIFPKGPTGVLIQQHHYQAVPSQCIFDSSYQNSDPRHSPFSGLNHSRMSSRLFNTINSVSGNRKMQTLLWGATGEQEWTPALTTVSKIIIGVDWKSLTIPACLPITTDYFPDEICLKTDYVFSDYNLLPDDVNADFAQQRSSEKKSLSTKEVFYELVSQRLAQGFQLIIDSESHIPDRGSAVIGPRSNAVSPSVQFKLSIGRVFHRIVLNGSEIRVTRYRPRHPYSPFVIHYRYRFQAPDHKTYGVSWVSFNTEKLENYNWNYLDHYICTRGDTDFALVEALKYWRFRIYVLPLSQFATRKILDGSETCDLYSPIGTDEQHSLKEGFLKYIENNVNRTRKTVKPSLKPDLSQLNTNSQLTRRRHSTGIMYLSKPQDVSFGYGPRMPLDKLISPRSGSKVLERGRVSPATDVMPLPINIVNDPDATSESIENVPSEIEVPPLPKTATIPEIIEAMKTPNTGLDFLTGYSYLPSHTFVVLDALVWLSNRLEGGMSQAKGLEFMEKLRLEGLICHASGDRSHPFLFGFYLFYFTAKEKGNDGPLDAAAFENEWVEVEAKQPHPPPEFPLFLHDNISRTCQFDTTSKRGAPLYKQAYLDISTNSRSDRVEWGHVRYHSAYRPDRAYELAIQWVAASGAIVSDLILGWARKIQFCGLQMVPIPADPLALPYSLKSDPLRGPVFVPVDLECLMGARSYLFEEFPEESWAERLVLFQEAIAIKFGFITCTIENGSRHHHNQYIHLSGNAFLLIPAAIPCEYSNQTQPRTSSISRRSTRQYPVYNELSTSPHQEYISRHVYSSGDDIKQETRVGFLWAWNHMVSRRWKWSSTPATCDEAFQNKILGDFQKFCANTDNRLKQFWDQCWFLKKSQSVT
ncbi:GATOR complex protein Iml1 isoform X2 [Bemisia tabaci]|uniref:GATOR complex protein Iml1 isoform X2 n=1 Tax=Bemisia tabaci TaxID=7038 RepID=UPI003B285A70